MSEVQIDRTQTWGWKSATRVETRMLNQWSGKIATVAENALQI